ncbi:ABC transporter ATP-binding protein [Helicobacter cetorum]|uniref:Dipeptide ABC transporter ATP-binding protein DppD n=2 Tax=Helicobacter cetorum TaxID=138563 RepID=I0EPP4_HELC0|nr:ABC transporter ATP-binding protein [Helicobacter cetorum]AFI04913.1 dipeptide ABC transporter ATP-binding protein DppD [Helicobacter cetorum MIT 00-7128]
MLLEVKDLKTYFFTDRGVNKAVDGVSFSLKKSQTLCIVGESGSGKSITSLSILGLIEKPGQIVGGSIELLGQDLLKLSPKIMQKEIRGKKIGMIFQEPMTSLNPSYTIGFQIDEVLKIHNPHLNKKERFNLVIEALEKVGIPQPRDKYFEYPFKLSGGQRQRVMIAMAMVCEPEILIADEPTTALDVTIQAQILELMKELQTKKGTSIIFITHDLGVVAQIADEVVVMYRGHVVEKASAKELFNNPKHPYTKALLNAIPKSGKEYRKKRLESVDENIDYLSFPKEIR